MVLATTEGALLAAVRPDGSGDVSETHVVWTAEDDLPNVCTPLSNGELVFLLTSDGLLTCYELRGGRRIWQKDFSAADREFQASPTLVADRLYLLDNTGATHVLKATRRPAWIGRAELGEPCPGASPAFAAGRIYLRARDHLYCIGSAGQ
jgi:outer membrane protein assembly factor BamB